MPDLESQDQPSITGQEEVLHEQHGSLFDGRAAAIHNNGRNADSRRLAPELTERQYAVLVCIGQGEPNKVIGRKLGITERTVKVHVREILRKLGASNRTQVAIAAGRNGIVADNVRLVPSHAPPPIKSSGFFRLHRRN